MRQTLVIALAAMAALAACGKKPADAPKAPAAPGSGPAAASAPTPLTPADMPKRAPGLWEQKMQVAGHDQTSSICLDKAIEERFSLIGQQAAQSDCAKPVITPRLGGGWDFSSSCNMGTDGGKTTTKGSVTGDFAKSYKLTATTTMSGAAMASMNGTHEMTIEATWKGPCPADMKPGDMVLPNGMKINMMSGPAAQHRP